MKAILIAGTIAGTLDLTTALLVNGMSIDVMGKFIASGAFGRSAFEGGNLIVVAGILFHYIIAFSWTITFFLLYPKVRLLQRNPIIVAIVYGIFIWIVMTLLVLPMTKINPRPFAWKSFFIGASILIAMIGVPVVMLARRFYAGIITGKE